MVCHFKSTVVVNVPFKLLDDKNNTSNKKGYLLIPHWNQTHVAGTPYNISFPYNIYNYPLKFYKAQRGLISLSWSHC